MGNERAATDLGLEETELCLGLPGGGVKTSPSGKRGFTETEANTETTTIDLKLQLQTSVPAGNQVPEKTKRGSVEKSNAESCARPPASKYYSFFLFFPFFASKYYFTFFSNSSLLDILCYQKESLN